MSELKKLFTPMEQAQEAYKSKIITADEAAAQVKSGMEIHLGLMNGVVVDIQKALAKRAEELEDVTVVATMWSYPDPPILLASDPKAEHFHYCSTHLTRSERAANKQGNCWFLPVQFRENPKLHGSQHFLKAHLDFASYIKYRRGHAEHERSDQP